jgi:hypothetical protein
MPAQMGIGTTTPNGVIDLNSDLDIDNKYGLVLPALRFREQTKQPL